jgi:hypothetical protein
MVFIRRKKMHGKHYYQLVRNYRQGGRHRQEVLCHLGVHDSVEGAIHATKQRMAYYRELVSSCQKEAARLKAQWQDAHGDEAEFWDEEEARDELAWMRWSNPYRGSAYFYSRRRRVGYGEEEWIRAREEWEVEHHLLELCVGYYDAMRDADLNKIRERQSREKLDNLLECQQKYSS